MPCTNKATLAPTLIRRAAGAAILVIAGLSVAHATCDFPPLQEQMSEQAFKQAGLDKLDANELASLNAWISRQADETCAEATADVAAAPASSAPSAPEPEEDRRGFERDFSDIQPIETRIVGEFKGWDGQTRFTLENGQVWKQVRGGSYRTKTVMNPRVTITPEFMGSWAFRVEDVGRVIRVKRIK